MPIAFRGLRPTGRDRAGAAVRRLVTAASATVVRRLVIAASTTVVRRLVIAASATAARWEHWAAAAAVMAQAAVRARYLALCANLADCYVGVRGAPGVGMG
ncbi:hypothetical protein Ari01nite_46510 [Paractinoplanes rishiriensis]|uniref:Uncharacterized protein n=1 Tax=Paractinoplanes rishiriensis TaxID=1050105 RepID=A0A919JXS3_9ACTN|nr:hypothetical protein Ari01nite_46510 [Actinoplanes rishiriensis]